MGNVIPFPANKEIALYEFVVHNSITTVCGKDPWNLIAEPYLEQGQDGEEYRKTVEHLGQLGFEPSEVEAIRKKVGPSLIAYNAFFWEWYMLDPIFESQVEANLRWELEALNQSPTES